MNSLALEFETEEEMKAVADKLWHKYGVTGELEMFQTPSGAYRLHIYAEKPIKESILEKLPGKRVQIKGSFGAAVRSEVSSGDN
ncbi:MAG TPA: hypothetical protein GX393_04815 [Firmicutes bacterium]|jgi:hypothetical protein|nr:hypothetical protein [Bacillota bacterium]